MIGIYKITNPNDRVYIGQAKNIKERWRLYRSFNCKSQPRLYNSLKKYGIDKHKFEIVCLCSTDELMDLERYYQELYNCTDKNGLNCELAASSNCKRVVSQETRMKLSIAGKGKKVSESVRLKMIGRKFSIETKLKIGNKNIGRKMPDSAKQKQRENNLGKKQSEEVIKKRVMSVLKFGRRVVLNIEYGIFYKSIKEAANTIDMAGCTLNKKLLGINRNNTPFIYV